MNLSESNNNLLDELEKSNVYCKFCCKLIGIDSYDDHAKLC